MEVLLHQNVSGVEGGIAEIGLHRGKSFVVLCLGLLPHQRAYGIDIFEAQPFNIDWSGKGSQAIVENNLRRFGISQPSVILDARSSNRSPPTTY